MIKAVFAVTKDLSCYIWGKGLTNTTYQTYYGDTLNDVLYDFALENGLKAHEKDGEIVHFDNFNVEKITAACKFEELKSAMIKESIKTPKELQGLIEIEVYNEHG